MNTSINKIRCNLMTIGTILLISSSSIGSELDSKIDQLTISGAYQLMMKLDEIGKDNLLQSLQKKIDQLRKIPDQMNDLFYGTVYEGKVYLNGADFSEDRKEPPLGFLSYILLERLKSQDLKFDKINVDDFSIFGLKGEIRKGGRVYITGFDGSQEEINIEAIEFINKHPDGIYPLIGLTLANSTQKNTGVFISKKPMPKQYWAKINDPTKQDYSAPHDPVSVSSVDGREFSIKKSVSRQPGGGDDPGEQRLTVFKIVNGKQTKLCDFEDWNLPPRFFDINGDGVPEIITDGDAYFDSHIRYILPKCETVLLKNKMI